VACIPWPWRAPLDPGIAASYFSGVTSNSIEVLVRFARLASEIQSAEGILPLLCDAIAEHVGAAAVAVVEIGPYGAKLIPSAHTPRELVDLELDPDAVGAETIDALLRACGGRFEHATARPLIAGGGLFGSVVMFFTEPPGPEKLSLGDGLIDVAAVALESVARMRQLVEQHAVLRAREETLAKSEKLRALGQMASGVSHDLKNILHPLSGYLQLAERALKRDKPEDAKDLVAKARQSLMRGVQTIERLRDYGRQSSDSKPEAIDLNQLVTEAVDVARPRMVGAGRAACAVDVDLGSPRAVMGQSGDIVNALVNVMVNALDAMSSSGGTLTIRTGSEGDSTWVEIADTGPGISLEVQARIFEPFFTTKGDEGTGLGLAMVHACMQRHGGSVKLESTVGEGTRFVLSFPRAT